MRARRHSAPPWERRSRHPRHPTGPARRRWPRAYDGGGPERRINRRYAEDYERDTRSVQRRRGVRLPMLESLRRTPVRNGLVGLAVAGAAAPLAINRYQQELRTDPTHERVATGITTPGSASETGVAEAYDRIAEESNSAAAQRERSIEQNLERYAEFGLTRELAEDIYDIAMASDVDPEIAFGLVRAESSFKNTSTSHVGAVGLTQLMPRTAAWLVPGTTTSELRNPETNLKIGMKYLRQMIDKYDGDVDLALTAYNRGPGTVDRILGRGGNPDNGYAGFVKTGDIGQHKG